MENVALIDHKKLKFNQGIFPIASGEKKFMDSNLLRIYQEASLYVVKGELNGFLTYELGSNRHVYIVVYKGCVKMNDILIKNSNFISSIAA